MIKKGDTFKINEYHVTCATEAITIEGLAIL